MKGNRFSRRKKNSYGLNGKYINISILPLATLIFMGPCIISAIVLSCYVLKCYLDFVCVCASSPFVCLNLVPKTLVYKTKT